MQNHARKMFLWIFFMKLMQKQLILLIYFCKGQSGNNNKNGGQNWNNKKIRGKIRV
jgi:hypothetical protein